MADNQAGTYGPPHPTIPLLTDMVCCAPAWGEDMAVEWRDYAPAPPVRIEVGPARKRNRVKPQAVCESGDRPRDVIPRVEPQAVCGDRPRDVILQPEGPGAGAPALPAPVSDDEMGFDPSALRQLAPPALRRRLAAAAAAPVAQRRPASATGGAKAHPKAKAPHAKAHPEAHPKAHPRPKELPAGWRTVIKQRQSGATAGARDKYYISSSGEVARSMIEVGIIMTRSRERHHGLAR